MKRSTAPGPSESQPYAKFRSSSSKRPVEPTDEMGEFEDAWEDEIESDEGDVADEGMDIDEEDGTILPALEDTEDDPQKERRQAFIPNRHTLDKDEVLVPDQSAYEMLHSMHVSWPCLSFDVLRDALGEERSRYPATAYVVTGTQADTAKANEILLMKMSSLHRTQKDEDESDSDEDGGENENLDEDAVLEYRSLPHFGGVNRIRAQPLNPDSLGSRYHVASFAETGKVHIWDMRPIIDSLDNPGTNRGSTEAIHTITSHGRAEGFAIDWAASPGSSTALRLLTGDINSGIYLTTTNQTGFSTQAQPFASHTSSIEDLQWSPAEPTVFASCSADTSIHIWDIRVKGRKSVVSRDRAHENDVNVISWNKSTSYLLLSGGDDGVVKTWDLRNFKPETANSASAVASFSWHKAPITSIEWHPTEDSIFAASGADDQVTLWDLSVEQDTEQMGAKDEEDVPSQLLFVHQGQKDIKEVHWHPQIPGVVVSTALDGFNVFKTISV